MSVLDKTTFSDIVDLLRPFTDNEQQRRQLVENLFIGTKYRPPDIDYSGGSWSVRVQMVNALVQYGKLDGKQALWRLLREGIYDAVGIDKQAEIDALKTKLDTHEIRLYGDDEPLQKKLFDAAVDKLPFAERNRFLLMQNVYNNWIKGVLREALRDVQFNIAAQDTPEHAGQSGKYPDYHIPQNLTLLEDGNVKPLHAAAAEVLPQVFHDVQGKLLILGAPGSGKTVLLLQLAEALLHEAASDNTVPIPVVLNLSSWAIKHEKLDVWIVEELQRSGYGVPKKLAEQLVGTDKLIFLLDGLDEVAEEQRDKCVVAINKFMTNRQVVVCSRIEEYKNLASELNTHFAITTQPLTDEEAEYYLSDHLQPEMVNNILSVLKTDTVVWHEVNKPLFINILISTYHDRSPSALPRVDGTVENQIRQMVIEPYIARQLQTAPTNAPYNNDQMRRYLSWLGWQLRQHELTTFYVEQIQADWLLQKAQWRFYLFSIVVITFCVLLYIVLPSILWFYGLANGIGDELQFGILTGLPIGFFSGISRVDLGKKLVLNRNQLLAGMRIGVGRGAFVGCLIGLWSLLQPRISQMYFGIDGVVVTTFVPIIMMLFALAGALFGAFLGALSSGFIATNPITQRMYPNQGLKNTLFIGLLVWIICWITFILFIWLLTRQSGWSTDSIFFTGLFGLPFGLFVGLGSVIKHIILRGLLWCKGVAPRRFDKFLYYAKDRRFMRQVGGGFIFIHRYILEYFAAQWDDSTAQS
jgi:eukaryotic-like serine/threonine-protein kinase